MHQLVEAWGCELLHLPPYPWSTHPNRKTYGEAAKTARSPGSMPCSSKKPRFASIARR